MLNFCTVKFITAGKRNGLDIGSTRDESQKHYSKPRRPDTKVHDLIHIESKKQVNYL